MRLCFDVDDTIADSSTGDYSTRLPFPGVPERLRSLKEAGHYLIYHTARYMVRHDGNKQKAHDSGWLELRCWLDEHGIPWDEIHLGKPSADFYIDDKGWRLSGKAHQQWDHLLEVIELSSC